MKEFLAEFLSDPMVVAIPRFIWLPILHGLILKRRPQQTAEKYRAIWMPEGSPLAVHTVRQAQLLSERLELPVRYAMRYGGPEVREVKAAMAPDTLVVPLYPQYSDSATGSVISLLGHKERAVRGFHDHPAYIAALAAGVKRHWNTHGRASMLLMSFHGLPKRGSETYEQQCRITAGLLAKSLGLKDGESTVTFQSRFGWAEWLQPYTEATLLDFAKRKVDTVDVVCPGFVSDCLETLEEIGITARQRYLAAGGRELRLVPCLNESDEWIAALAAIASAA